MASANEARQFADGRVLSTCQASYRLDRIESLLRQRQDHGFDSMRAISSTFTPSRLNVSKTALNGYPMVLCALLWRPGTIVTMLNRMAHMVLNWCIRPLDMGLGKHSVVSGLRDDSHDRVWFLVALTHRPHPECTRLGEDALGRSRMRVVSETHSERPEPWGQIQELYLPNLFGLYLMDGFKRGPFPFEGGRATPCQAQLLPTGADIQL